MAICMISLDFEPIHRLMFDLPQDYDIVAEFKHYAGKVDNKMLPT